MAAAKTQKISLQVKGMSCGHCINHVQEEIMKLPEVADFVVDLNPEGVSQVDFVTGTEISDAELAAAIDEAGYDLEKIERA